MATRKMAKKAPKAKQPVERYIVVKDNCDNIESDQLDSKAVAVRSAEECAHNDVGESYTVWHCVPSQRFTVPDACKVEDLV